MALSRDSRDEKKLKLLLRAQFRVKQGFERVDWEYDTLYPQIEALKAGKPVLGLESGMAFDLVVVDENPAPAPTKKRK